MAALIALALLFAGIAACLAPVFAPESRAAEPDPLEALEAERERLVAAIRDADLDLAMGKISAADHQDMRRALEGDALKVLARLEAIRQ